MIMPSSLRKRSARFTAHPSYGRLKKLAKRPPDLSQKGVLTKERIDHYSSHAAGWTLLYGTERIDNQIMEQLKMLADESGAVEKMRAMQEGEVTCYLEDIPSETRAVLHTALRDFYENPHTAPTAADAAARARKELDKLQDFLQENDRTNRYKTILCAAIGGSDLGPKALYLGLRSLQRSDRAVRFISNLDPDCVAEALEGLDLESTLVSIISKSGGTLETVTNEKFLREKFTQAGLNPKEHFISITQQGSPMDDRGLYKECFYLWPWVGGRFSGTSMGGAVTLGFTLGMDVLWEILRGANAMDKAALTNDFATNPPLLSALLSIWNRNFLDHPTMVMVPYAEALHRFPAHVQQVKMESNGKRIDRRGQAVDFGTGEIVWGEPGTSAQHSFYQLIHQGTDVIPLELIGFAECQRGVDTTIEGTTSQEKLLANLIAQAIALATGQQSDNPNQVFPGNRPSHILLAKKLNPFALGALFAYVEHKAAFQGFVWDINSFDQEGVQLGKVLANKVIDQIAGRADRNSFPLGQAFLDQVRGLH